MGKTEGGAVWLNGSMTSPYDFWQYWRNTEDADVGKFLRLFTTLPIDEIRKLEALGGSEINEAKKVLAFEATRLCHSEAEALAAAETARKTFEQGGAGDNLPGIEIPEETLKTGISIVELLKQSGLVTSNGEAKRLIEGGGARLNDQPVNDVARTAGVSDLTSDGYIKLSSGKKKHALVRIKA